MLKAARRASDFLQEEIRPAEDWIAGFFTDWDNRMAQYVGPGWRGNLAENDADDYYPENFAYEWMSMRASQLVLGNPRVRITTSRSGPARELAKAHQLAENRWIRETKMRALNEKLVADYGQHRAVALVLPNQDDDFSDKDDPKGWPAAKRISPRRSYVYDVHAIEKEDELWRGHKTVHQKHELLERAEANPDEHWNAQAIEGLTEEYGVEEMRGKGRDQAVHRHEVVLYSIWIRDYKPTKADRKRHGDAAWDRQLRFGAWLTLALVEGGEKGKEKSGWVRHPYPYWGHQGGPYVVIDGHTIPDETVGLAPIPALAEEVRELNVHARAISRAMRHYKKGVMVDGSDPEFEEKIKGFEDHWVVGLDGLDDIDKKVKEIEIAGATDQHFKHIVVCRERVTRKGGITDVERGKTDPGVTATADKLAADASSTKVGFDAVKFIEGIREILERVSIYLAFDETRTLLGPEALRILRDPETGQSIEKVVGPGPTYTGGISSQQEADWFRSLSLEIEPYSMGSTSDALDQQRVLQLINTIAVLLPMMAQYPFVLWDELIETIGEMQDIPNLSDYFDPEALRQFQTLMLQGQQIEAKQGMGVPQARLSQDVSRMLSGGQAMPNSANMLGSLLAGARAAKVA